MLDSDRSAGVVKLVDAPDSKSGGPQSPWGFDSPLRHSCCVISEKASPVTRQLHRGTDARSTFRTALPRSSWTSRPGTPAPLHAFFHTNRKSLIGWPSRGFGTSMFG